MMYTFKYFERISKQQREIHDKSKTKVYDFSDGSWPFVAEFKRPDTTFWKVASDSNGIIFCCENMDYYYHSKGELETIMIMEGIEAAYQIKKMITVNFLTELGFRSI